MPKENQPDRRLCYVAAIQDYQGIATLTPEPMRAVYLSRRVHGQTKTFSRAR